MRFGFLFILIVTCLISHSKIRLKVYSIETSDGYELLADNEEYCPISLKLILSLQNLTSSVDTNAIHIVPSHVSGHKLAILKSKDKGKYKMSFTTRYVYGDVMKRNIDTSFTYFLPFEKGTRNRVAQGYNGWFSHRNENALDFAMPVGTTICAARGGIVLIVADTNNRGCGRKECAKYNNKIVIYHKDGTFGNYLHIDHHVALVREGDTVQTGQPIARSGNTGRTTGPHLHFSVGYYEFGKRITIETKFLTGNGSKKQMLKPMRWYSRKYD